MDNFKIKTLIPGETKKEKEYDHFLEHCPKTVVQQTIAWRNVIKDLSPDEPIFILAEKNGNIKGVLPCYIYRSSLGSIITSIPHAGPLGGVACNSHSKEKEEVYRKLMEEMVLIGKKEKCSLATIITSPFLKDYNIYKKSFSYDYTFRNFTQCVDLSKPLNLSHGIRNNVNKGLKSGIKVFELNHKSDLKIWYEIHKKRMKELKSEPIKYNLFLNCFKYLIPKNARFFKIIYKNEVIGGCLYIFHNDIIDVYMISCNSEYNKLSPATLLTNHTINWAKKHGFRYYNFQSSKKRGDGVYRFKQQWGSLDLPYFFLTKKIGDISKILSIPLETIKKEFKWHYVLPYSMWSEEEIK